MYSVRRTAAAGPLAPPAKPAPVGTPAAAAPPPTPPPLAAAEPRRAPGSGAAAAAPAPGPLGRFCQLSTRDGTPRPPDEAVVTAARRRAPAGAAAAWPGPAAGCDLFLAQTGRRSSGWPPCGRFQFEVAGSVVE